MTGKDPARTAMNRLRLTTLLILLGLLAFGAPRLWPYMRTPALIQNPTVISETFADIVTRRVAYAALSAGSGQAYMARPVGGIDTLCAPSEIHASSAATCQIARVGRLAGCWNRRGCAAIEVHPALLRTPRFARVVKAAITRPCDGAPSDPTPATGSAAVARFEFTRKLLGCGRGGPGPVIRSVDEQNGLIVIDLS